MNSLNSSDDQKFEQNFENKAAHDVLLKIDTTVVATLPTQGRRTLRVSEGDRIIVDLPDGVNKENIDEIGQAPLYMSKARSNKTIAIAPLRQYGAFNEHTTKKSELSMPQNLVGMDIAKYDPLYVGSSFKSENIFQGMGTYAFNYKFSDGMVVPLGFSYTGRDNILKGTDTVSSYFSSRKFQESMNIGVQAEVPVKPGVTVAGGFDYSKTKKENSSTNDVFYSSNAEYSGYTVSLEDYNLVDVLLTEKFMSAVKNLNSEADVKEKIIDVFGTHYPQSVTYGGYWRSWKQISESDYYSMEKQGIDVNASVNIATPGKTITNKLTEAPGASGTTHEYAEESKSGGKKGNAAFNFSHVSQQEAATKLSKSNGDYYSIGGRAGNEAAISTKLNLITHLIQPHVFKDGTTEEELAPKREWIEDAIINHMDAMPRLEDGTPEFDRYKVKLEHVKRLKDLDDANKSMKGAITLIMQLGGKIKNTTFWQRDDFDSTRKGEIQLSEKEKEFHILKVPREAEHVRIFPVLNLVGKDDAFGDDKHETESSEQIMLADVKDMQTFTAKASHKWKDVVGTTWEHTQWEAKFVIVPITDGVIYDNPANAEGLGNRAATVSSPVKNTPVLPTKSHFTKNEFENAAYGVSGTNAVKPSTNYDLTNTLVNNTFRYEPYANGYHAGTFVELSNGELEWTNDAGASWTVRPDYANMQLDATVGSNPYKNTAVGKVYKFVMKDGKLVGLDFNGGIFQLKAKATNVENPVKRALLNGTFKRRPYENGYHGGAFEEDRNGDLKWVNDAGVSWTLRPDLDNKRLDATIGSNPYKNNPNGKFFKLLMEDERITGFDFQREIYHLEGT